MIRPFIPVRCFAIKTGLGTPMYCPSPVFYFTFEYILLAIIKILQA